MDTKQHDYLVKVLSGWPVPSVDLGDGSPIVPPRDMQSVLAFALADLKKMEDSPEQARQDRMIPFHGGTLHYQPDFFRQFFTSPFEQYADRVGQPFKVLQRLPDAQSNDNEPGEEMYRIQFEDGAEIDAWGHEVCVLYKDNK